MEDRIEKQIEIKAPVSRVWRAITDYRQFGEWFRVDLEAPFVAGHVYCGRITYPGYEHLKWEATVKEIRPETLFSFTWHPHGIDPEYDYSQEAPTLVEFRLDPTSDGTLLTLTESGFSQLPEHRRFTAFRGNENGWSEQMKNITSYVANTP